MTTCFSCKQKQQLVNKYVKLIKLLKSKHEKSVRSIIKNSSLPSQSLFETSTSNQKIEKSICARQLEAYELENLKHEKTKNLQAVRLGLTVICNKSKNSFLRYSLNCLKSVSVPAQQLQLPIKRIENLIESQIPFSILNFIQKSLVKGKELQLKKSAPLTQSKSLYLKNLQLQLINNQLQQKNSKLKKQLELSELRFFKQTQKKKESLKTVAEELREKADYINELLHIIRQYEKISGKSYDKICVENILVEDELQIGKICLRLQNINQKLNNDIRNAQNKISELSSEILLVKKQNENLKTQVEQLKYKNFDLMNQVNKNSALGNSYATLCQKLNQRLEKAKFNQKRNLMLLKSNSRQNNCFHQNEISSCKIVEATSDSTPKSKKSFLNQLQTEQKLQQIYAFIFNIQAQNYRIQNEKIFDKDELNLLRFLKNSYLNSIHNQKAQIWQKPEKKHKNLKLNQTDEVFYLKSQSPNLESSFFNVLDTKKVEPKNSQSNQIKLINLQIQKSRLIERINDLKNMHMHIRNVFLNFIKTLQLKYFASYFSNLTIETESILEIIFNFFQYSEDEKSSLFKLKKKKFLGIL